MDVQQACTQQSLCAIGWLLPCFVRQSQAKHYSSDAWLLGRWTAPPCSSHHGVGGGVQAGGLLPPRGLPRHAAEAVTLSTTMLSCSPPTLAPPCQHGVPLLLPPLPVSRQSNSAPFGTRRAACTERCAWKPVPPLPSIMGGLHASLTQRCPVAGRRSGAGGLRLPHPGAQGDAGNGVYPHPAGKPLPRPPLTLPPCHVVCTTVAITRSPRHCC
jgi:hypothetical protein